MRKKLVASVGLIVVVGGVLAGCSTQDPIYFEGKQMPVENVEEILGDRIEDENGIDYILTIREDTGE